MLRWTGSALGETELACPEVGGIAGRLFAFGGGVAAGQLTGDSTFGGNGLQVDVATRVTEGENSVMAVTLKTKDERRRRHRAELAGRGWALAPHRPAR